MVANDQEPAPVIKAVDLDTMAVTERHSPIREVAGKTRPPDFVTMLVSPGGTTLYLSAGQDLQVYDAATMTTRHTLPQHTKLSAHDAQTPDGRYLFLVTSDGSPSTEGDS